MPEGFIPLVAIVRARSIAPTAAASAPPAEPASVVRGVIDFAHADIVHELTLMRLAALEACERGVAVAVRLCATELLARELAIAPVDVEALAKRALERFAAHEPISLTVSPHDAERVRAPLPTRVDPALAAGDLVVVVRDGSFESTFAFRLEDAFRRATE